MPDDEIRMHSRMFHFLCSYKLWIGLNARRMPACLSACLRVRIVNSAWVVTAVHPKNAASAPNYWWSIQWILRERALVLSYDLFFKRKVSDIRFLTKELRTDNLESYKSKVCCCFPIFEKTFDTFCKIISRNIGSIWWKLQLNVRSLLAYGRCLHYNAIRLVRKADIMHSSACHCIIAKVMTTRDAVPVCDWSSTMLLKITYFTFSSDRCSVETNVILLK